MEQAKAAQTFDSVPVCSVTAEAFICGRLTVPWDRMGKVGVSHQRDRRMGTTAYYVHFAYRDEKTGRLREALTMIPSPGHPLVGALHARVAPGSWLQTQGYLAMRKALGFSNKVVYLILVGAIVLAFAITAAIAWSAIRGRR